MLTVVTLVPLLTVASQTRRDGAEAPATPLREQADSLRLLGYRQYTGGDAARALAAFEQELTLRRSDSDRAAEATTMSNIGRALETLGRRDSAMVLYRAALRIQLAAGDSADAAVTLNNIGAAFRSLGEADSAARYFRAVVPLIRASGNRAREAIALNNLGALYDNLGQRDSALAYFRDALTILLSLGDRVGEATLRLNLGLLFAGVGAHDSAMTNYRTALSLARLTGERSAEGRALNNIAALFDAITQRDSAEAYFRVALSLERAAGDRASEAVTLSNLGAVFAGSNKPDSAIAYFRLSLPLFRALGGRTGEARMLTNLGDVLRAVGQRDAAASSYRASLALSRAVGDRAAEATALKNLGSLYYAQRHVDSALTYLRAAQTMHREVGDRAAEAAALYMLAVAFDARAQRDSALRALRRAAWLQAAVTTTAPGDFLRIASVEDAGGDVASLWARVALQANPVDTRPSRSRVDTLEAWGALERGRGQALRALRRGGALTEDSAVVTRVAVGAAAMLARVSRPGRAFVTFDHYRDTLLVLAVSATGILRAVRVALPTDSLQRLTLRVRALAGARGLQRAAAGSALPISVTRGATAANFELRVVAGDSTAPQVLVRSILPAAIHDAIDGASELVIIPDGLLSQIPWAFLPMGSAGTPLGAGVAVRIVPSLTTLDELTTAFAERSRERPTRAALGAGALIVGDPAMPAGVPSLPGARAEAHWVADTLLAGRRATLLIARAATVREVRAKLSAAPLIHFATHAAAFPDAASSRGSYLQFAAVDSGTPSVLTVGDLLDAAESDRLRLRARLVVLSACETGVGASSATEGVLGLQRAFLALGAETLLVSLWKVDDRATRALIGAFYRHWLDDPDGPSAAESLKRAQGDMRNGRMPNWQSAWAKPSAWAAFQVVGAG